MVKCILIFCAVAIVAALFWVLRIEPRQQTVTTSYSSITPHRVDSVAKDSVNIYYFQDSAENSRWSAEVVGRDVELRSLVLRDYDVRGGIVPRGYDGVKVSLRGGVQYNGVTTGRWVGLGVERQWGRVSLDLEAGVDPYNGTGHAAATAKIIIW